MLLFLLTTFSYYNSTKDSLQSPNSTPIPVKVIPSAESKTGFVISKISPSSTSQVSQAMSVAISGLFSKAKILPSRSLATNLNLFGTRVSTFIFSI